MLTTLSRLLTQTSKGKIKMYQKLYPTSTYSKAKSKCIKKCNRLLHTLRQNQNVSKIVRKLLHNLWQYQNVSKIVTDFYILRKNQNVSKIVTELNTICICDLQVYIHILFNLVTVFDT